MVLHRLATKEDFQKLIKYLREYITDYYKDDDDEDKIIDFSSFTSKILQFRSDSYYDKKFNRIINVFEFVDEFKVEISEEELDTIILILFNEVDLMSQNTEVEIKKKEDICFKNIWHFDKDLFEFFKNGDVNRIHTMINYFKEEGREIYEGTCETNDVVNALMKKCTYINKYDEYVYKFDNGIQFSLNEDDLKTIAIVIVDAY